MSTAAVKAPDLAPVKGGWKGRFRCGSAGRPYAVIRARKADIAADHAQRIQDLIEELIKAGLDAYAPVALKNLAEQSGEIAFRGVERGVRDMMAETASKRSELKPITFRDVAERFLSGDLNRLYPDSVDPLRDATIKSYRTALTLRIYPHIGDLPVTAITLDDCDAVKRSAAQRGDGNSTRGKAYLLVKQILGYCVEPLRLIKQTPIPENWCPSRARRTKAFQFLTTNDDAQLMLCVDLPLRLRLLFGVIARNGCRISEALALQWRDVNPTTGACTLDHTKTHSPRWWTLDDDVLRALLAVKPEGATPEDLIWPEGEDGIVKSYMADGLRKACRVAGLDKTRPELFVNEGTRRHLVEHDLRATFVTVALAQGWSEFDVMRRTGHQSSTQLHEYRRDVPEVLAVMQRLGAEWFRPLDQLLDLGSSTPRAGADAVRDEAADGLTDVAQLVAQIRELPEKQAGLGSSGVIPKYPSQTENSEKHGVKAPRNPAASDDGPPENGGVARSTAEFRRAQLVAGIAAAAAAGRFALADRLESELVAHDATSTDVRG